MVLEDRVLDRGGRERLPEPRRDHLLEQPAAAYEHAHLVAHLEEARQAEVAGRLGVDRAGPHADQHRRQSLARESSAETLDLAPIGRGRQRHRRMERNVAKAEHRARNELGECRLEILGCHPRGQRGRGRPLTYPGGTGAGTQDRLITAGRQRWGER